MSSAALLGRMAISLAVVLVLMGAVAKFARKRGGFGLGSPRGAKVEVVTRHSVAKSASLAVVRVGGRDLLVGITPSTVSLLLDGEEGSLVPAEAQRDQQPEQHEIRAGLQGLAPAVQGNLPSSPWKVMLDQLRERTVRR